MPYLVMGVTLLLLLSSLGLALPAQAQNCTRPKGGENMDLKGSYILLDTFPDGTRVSFACAVGYTAAGGSPSITCTAGSWSPLRLKCERRNCGAAEEVPNGYIDYPQGTEFGDELLVICNEGFRLTGRTNKRLCGAQGWMGKMPECEAVTCDPPPPVESGTFRPDNDVYQYGEVVEYSCQKDYTLSGPKTVTCSANGGFNPAPPTCIKVQCEEPRITNAVWIEGSQPPHGYLSTVTYMCKRGYTMMGEPTLTCGRDSQWSPGLPTCELVTCDPPPTIVNGNFHPNKESYDYNDVVEYSCQKDYTLSGSRSIHCSAHGRFEPAPPTCIKIQCEEPHITNAVWIKGSRPPHGYLSTVTYMCKPGYTMIGEPTLTCGRDGQWSPGLPTCQLVTCDPPPTIVNGNFHPNKESYDYNDVVEYSCQKDYTLSGSRSIHCSAHGGFEPAPPTCIKVQCEEPRITNAEWIGGSQPPHGYLSMVTYMCKPGYTMTGEPTLTCGRDDQWSPGLPTCELVTCDPPPTIVNGTFHPKKESYDYSEVVEYCCKKDYTLSGSRSIYCSAHGRFEPAPPTCIMVQCEEPVIRNAERIWGSQPPHGYLSTVTYMCKPGYTMIGESTLTCGRDGQWSPGLPTCQLIQCEEPRITNAERIGGRPPYGYQSMVTYMCKPGYTMTGESTLTCGRDGQWSPGLPTCELVTCDPPPPVESGTFRPDKEIYLYRDVVEYSCPKDYTLSGSRLIYCSIYGRFDPAPPTCIKVQCEEPGITSAGWISGSRSPHGHQSTVTYQCSSGYTMCHYES